ncbi:hypothetical protein EW146_g9691 [Bondarzewia mesenterica]|uniref:Uncharacterized protein n=1 Tax=Bondarzewia mesenterica TaxID=1095465 RepID=A0A4V3XCN0_9AGAM|nr:hypothetical protein EW146_g9691 [Bondarzewia mesenterica]
MALRVIYGREKDGNDIDEHGPWPSTFFSKLPPKSPGTTGMVRLFAWSAGAKDKDKDGNDGRFYTVHGPDALRARGGSVQHQPLCKRRNDVFGGRAHDEAVEGGDLGAEAGQGRKAKKFQLDKELRSLFFAFFAEFDNDILSAPMVMAIASAPSVPRSFSKSKNKTVGIMFSDAILWQLGMSDFVDKDLFSNTHLILAEPQPCVACETSQCCAPIFFDTMITAPSSTSYTTSNIPSVKRRTQESPQPRPARRPVLRMDAQDGSWTPLSKDVDSQSDTQSHCPWDCRATPQAARLASWCNITSTSHTNQFSTTHKAQVPFSQFPVPPGLSCLQIRQRPSSVATEIPDPFSGAVNSLLKSPASMNPTVTGLAAYLTTISHDQLLRQARVCEHFMHVCTDDLESVRVERAICQYLYSRGGCGDRATTLCPTHSKQAKEWMPDTSSQQIIDEMVRYTVIAKCCSLHLRSLDSKKVKRMWDEVQKAWSLNSKGDRADSVIPSSTSQGSDLMARERFRCNEEIGHSVHVKACAPAFHSLLYVYGVQHVDTGIMTLESSPWLNMFNINIHPFFYLTKYAIPYMPSGSSIIFNASINFAIGHPELGLFHDQRHHHHVHAHAQQSNRGFARGIQVNGAVPSIPLLFPGI